MPAARARFDLLRRGAGLHCGTDQDGWVKSNVFGRSFRFTQQRDCAAQSAVHAGGSILREGQGHG